MPANQILYLLNQIIDGELQLNELKDLVGLCSKIALSVLRNRYESHSNRFLTQGLTFNDIALDSIASFFIKDKSGELPLRKALLSWDKEIKDEASAYYFLSKIISNRIEQEIAKKLKEADPFFGKILRSINHLVETNRINKSSWFGVVYLLEKKNNEIIQKPIESEFIKSLPAKLFIGSNEKIISNLFSYIKTETDFFPAIPLNALIRKIKQVNGSFLQQRSSETIEEHFEEELNVERIVNESLNAVNDKLEKFYLDKGKLNADETVVFKNVLIEISNDLKDGGVSRGLYEYLSPYMIGLSKEDFYRSYHQTLDYLLRLLKKEIADRLEDSNN